MMKIPKTPFFKYFSAPELQIARKGMNLRKLKLMEEEVFLQLTVPL